jgi:DNA (cytosine-5)-methyltransferase 1
MFPRKRGQRTMLDFYEFFAGGGMARAGLGQGWKCQFANDFDFKKAATYKLNWGADALKIGDVSKLAASDLPGSVDLAWASFPCQDLSLAGGGAGLRGDRSGTFWPFWQLIKDLRAEGRAPRVIVLENVCGALTSHEGKDFSAIASALTRENYQFGGLVIDAALFVPHSRPRLFVIGVREDISIPDNLRGPPSSPWHTKGLSVAYEGLAAEARENWIWWSIPTPSKRNSSFADLIEENPTGVVWHTENETERLFAMMGEINLRKVEAAKKANRLTVGAVYKRTRHNQDGEKVQRAEVRFDDIAGCLRTPAGGSSRQLILVVKGRNVRSRLISSRETARLMGLPDEYKLPDNYNQAYHLTGDGVVVPVVRHLAAYLIEPLLINEFSRRVAA